MYILYGYSECECMLEFQICIITNFCIQYIFYSDCTSNYLAFHKIQRNISICFSECKFRECNFECTVQCKYCGSLYFYSNFQVSRTNCNYFIPICWKGKAFVFFECLCGLNLLFVFYFQNGKWLNSNSRIFPLKVAMFMEGVVRYYLFKKKVYRIITECW